MNNFELKDSIISEIRKFHPGNRPEKYKHYGWYIGGMADTGDWYFETMIRDTSGNLAECLAMLQNPSNFEDPYIRRVREQDEKAWDNRKKEWGLVFSSDKEEFLTRFRYGVERTILWGSVEKRAAKLKASEGGA